MLLESKDSSNRQPTDEVCQQNAGADDVDANPGKQANFRARTGVRDRKHFDNRFIFPIFKLLMTSASHQSGRHPL